MIKTMKRIASIGLATTLVAATLAGAMAANLQDLPAPFVKNGVADFKMVVGKNAATSDVIGAIDIAISLQAAAVQKKNADVIIPSGPRTISGGVKVAQSGNDLLLGESLTGGETKFDKTDLPVLLGDGTITEEDDNTEYDYSQEITLSENTRVRFDRSDSDVGSTPIVYLDTDNGGNSLWNYTIDFKGKNLDVTSLEDSEAVSMLGKTFTFDPKNTNSSEIRIFGSDITRTLAYGDSPITVMVEGKSYTLTVTGGTTADSADRVTVSVNGQSQTLIEGQSKTINGLKVYAKTVVVNEQPTFSASATLFIGSGEIKLPAAAATCSLTSVQVGGTAVTGLDVCVVSASATSGNKGVDKIIFQYTPQNLNSGDTPGFVQTNFLKEGEQISDPLFGTFNVVFAGATAKLDDADKSRVELKNSGNDFEVSFQNNDGKTQTFKPFKLAANGSVVVFAAADANGEGYNGSVSANTPIYNRQIFILNEGTTEKTTKVFEVTGFTTENSVAVVRLKDWSGNTNSYAVNDKVIDGVTVSGINVAQKLLNLSAATSNILYLKGGKNNLALENTNLNGPASSRSITLTEADVDQATATTITFLAKNTTDTDFEATVSTLSGTQGTNTIIGNYRGDTDAGSKTRYYLTQYGTYVVADIDDKNEVTFYVPESKDEEVSYDVFFAPSGSQITTGSGDGATVITINPIAVGLTLLDSDVKLQSMNTNLIIVGGPCANSIASNLLGNPASCVSGFTPGFAKIQLFDLSDGKVAMLVAGYSAQDTQAATRAVATRNGNLKGTLSTVTVRSVTDYTVSST